MKHFIILSSSYSEGTRIAMDFVLERPEVKSEINDLVKQITEKCGNDVSLSTHFLETSSKDWESVVLADDFFSGVKLIHTDEEFISLIQKDRKLDSLSVAKYILSKIKCTHLQLEKLVYLCFADYLCSTGKPLFDDTIYAFEYGPVVKTVYDEYKKYHRKAITIEPIESKYEMPLRSRISFAEDGHEKLLSIDKTLKKYGCYSAPQLVNITHTVGGPWEITYDHTPYKIIPSDIIKEYHYLEKV